MKGGDQFEAAIKFTTDILDPEIELGAEDDYDADDLIFKRAMAYLKKKYSGVAWKKGEFRVDATGWDEMLSQSTATGYAIADGDREFCRATTAQKKGMFETSQGRFELDFYPPGEGESNGESSESGEDL